MKSDFSEKVLSDESVSGQVATAEEDLCADSDFTEMATARNLTSSKRCACAMSDYMYSGGHFTESHFP
jgi:hypothetical protein